MVSSDGLCADRGHCVLQARPPGVRLLLQHPGDCPGEFGRTVHAGALDRPRRVDEVPTHNLHDGVARKRQVAGEHLVGAHSKRVLVGGLGDGPSQPLLRAHVDRRAHGGPSHGQSERGSHRSDPEVGYDRLALFIHHDVGRLHIAMDHAVAVGVGQGAPHLVKYPLNYPNR